MSEIKTQLKTINLQGKQYAQVNERIKAFHSQYPNGSIQTEPSFQKDIAIVKAIIIPDIEKPTRAYSAHSYGAIKGVKAFEKLETVAVGRALAYLGFSIDGSIASAEEMEVFEAKQDEPKQEAKPNNQKQLAYLHVLIGELATKKEKDKKEVENWLKTGWFSETFKLEIESWKDATQAQIATLIEWLKKELSK